MVSETSWRDSLFVAPTYAALCEHVAAQIAQLVTEKPQAVLGLATGATPCGVYEALVRRHQTDHLDFSGVTCFNLDEYYPMPADNPHSYHMFMQANLFGPLAKDSANGPHWHVPSGRLRSRAALEEHCWRYEAAIVEAGGIDWQLLGIGRSGHLGFNEPGSAADSRTRLVALHPLTRADAAPEFGGLDKVPTQAITLGLGTIFEAREIVLMASGAGKAGIVNRALTGEITEQVPASLIRRHPQVHVCLDQAAAQAIVSPEPGV